ncbi:MAG: polysaccharide deacetylase family protein [Bryobacterales bacterium]|nr:polysaccharide deacetylase family protein [Bryobacterales bacterium]
MLELAVGSAAVVACAAMGYAVRGRSATVFGPSVWRGTTDRAAVALTFDDGPSESTPDLLEILDRYGARATFFICGRNAERLPAVVREAAAAGHEIANHTYSHPLLCFRTERFLFTELRRTQDIAAELTGRAPKFWRAPYGVRWFGARAVQRRLGLLGVMWTAIARDWRFSAAAIVARLAKAGNGSILCLHDGRELTERPNIRETLRATAVLLPLLRDRGFTFSTVSEILCPTN